METKRLGLASKSLFVVPNHIIEQFASEFLQLYPSANILVATKKDFATNNRKKFCDGFYSAQSDDERVLYLATLPHIGKITANHLARNLGIDIVKYDVWIQRLGVLYGGNMAFFDKINNGKLSPEIKKICDDMFEKLSKDTGLPRGYIDVVLWKSAQTGLIKF